MYDKYIGVMVKNIEAIYKDISKLYSNLDQVI